MRSALWTAAGARSMTRRYARVGPSGSRLPCSQCRSVLTLNPNRAANVCWVIPSFLRIAFTSTWAGTWTRYAFLEARPFAYRTACSKPFRILSAVLLILWVSGTSQPTASSIAENRCGLFAIDICGKSIGRGDGQVMRPVGLVVVGPEAAVHDGLDELPVRRSSRVEGTSQKMAGPDRGCADLDLLFAVSRHETPFPYAPLERL